MNAATPIRVLVGELNGLAAEAMSALLQREAGFELLGAEADSTGILERLSQAETDVLLFASRLPGLPMASLFVRLKEIVNPPRCLVLLDDENDEQLATVIQAGATGLISRDASVEELIEAVRKTETGQRNVSTTVQQRLIANFAGIQDSADDPVGELTDRERTVLRLTAEGLSFSEIGRQLGISARTAETHRSNLARKLGLSSRNEIIRFAIRNGVIEA